MKNEYKIFKILIFTTHGLLTMLKTCSIYQTDLNNTLGHVASYGRSYLDTIGLCRLFFSSPEPKARVSYCHSAPSVVRRP